MTAAEGFNSAIYLHNGLLFAKDCHYQAILLYDTIIFDVMDPTSLLPQWKENFQLYYLVPISFVYLYTLLGAQTYLLYALIALFGAAARHASGEAMYGPGAEAIDEIDHEEEIHRRGTILFRDKKPFAYSASSFRELYEEGQFQSKAWGVIITAISILEFLFAPMYIFAFYELFTHRKRLEFIGALLLFALSALLIYGLIRELLPNAHELSQERPSIDPELRDMVLGFLYTLNEDGVSITNAEYEPAVGGVFRFEAKFDSSLQEGIEEDINRAAVTFCSIVHRSPYPVDKGKFEVTTDDGAIIRFEINARWARKLLNQQMSSDEFLNHVHQTITDEALSDEAEALTP